jgi:histone H1/5
MVVESISTLKERGGSSLQAIKKHISANNKVDIDRLTPFIRRFLKNAVTNGTLIQTKGKEASGSFKMSGATKKKQDRKLLIELVTYNMLKIK